jgi:hypothetical protein
MHEFAGFAALGGGADELVETFFASKKSRRRGGKTSSDGEGQPVSGEARDRAIR